MYFDVPGPYCKAPLSSAAWLYSNLLAERRLKWMRVSHKGELSLHLPHSRTFFRQTSIPFDYPLPPIYTQQTVILTNAIKLGSKLIVSITGGGGQVKKRSRAPSLYGPIVAACSPESYFQFYLFLPFGAALGLRRLLYRPNGDNIVRNFVNELEKYPESTDKMAKGYRLHGLSRP